MSLNGNSVEAGLSENNNFWSVVSEAVRGSKRDFTTSPIGISLFILAVPMVVEMLAESLFAIVDIFFVGRLGADAVAVVGLTESMMALVYALAFGLAIGTTATIARRIGEKDPDGAALTATHVIYLAIGVSLVMSVLFVVFAEKILIFLGGSPTVVEMGIPFMRIMLGGNAAVVFLFILNAMFRGAGDAAIAMRVLWLANGLNMVLSPCFIFGIAFFPQLGVTGAAVGTTMGRGLGVVFACWYLFRGEKRFEIHKRHWRLDLQRLWSLARLSSTALLQMLVSTLSWSVLVRVVAGFTSDAIAGYVICMRIVIFALLPALGLSNAAATMVGQNLGAGKPERSEAAVWNAAIANAVFYLCVGIVLLLFAHPIVSFFTNVPAVLEYGASGLHIIAFGFLFYGVGMVMETAFNGAGDTWTPTYINFVIFWVFEIPIAYLLAFNFEMGPNGVFWAITLSFSLLAVVAGLMFRRGKWKLQQV